MSDIVECEPGWCLDASATRGPEATAIVTIGRSWPHVCVAVALAAGLAAVSHVARACTVPVFRYALDRWEADPFRLVVPEAVLEDRETLKRLAPLRGNGVANLVVEEQGGPADEARLLFPHDDAAIWQGTITTATLDLLLDSPARRKLLAAILAGDSVVWVVMTRSTDASEVERVATRLRFLEQVAELPEQDPDDPDSRLGPGPELKLGFSVIECRLDEPAERIFVRGLAGPRQRRLVDEGVPFAAAVFGRGRVLDAWPLADLDDRTIEDATLFLTGRCSCRMKAGNPGWDLLLAVDWDRSLMAAAGTAGDGIDEGTVSAADASSRSVDVTPSARPDRPEVETVAISPTPSPGADAANGLSRVRLGGIALAVLVAFAGWRLWRAR